MAGWSGMVAAVNPFAIVFLSSSNFYSVISIQLFVAGKIMV